MQQDSPGNKQTPSRNERYAASVQPKLLSVSAAKKKADKFAAKDDKKARVGAKKAILQELSTHLSVRAQGLQLRTVEGRGRNPYGEQKNDTRKATKSKKKSKIAEVSKIGKTADGKEIVRSRKAQKPEGYTWDKNGRQQELRIRFLARKYLALWRRNTYGKVTPSDARAHYEHSLKRKVLRLWQDIWWSGRKGWKLNIRAEYHDRYRMWQKVFRVWRLFVMLSRAKKTKYKLAVQYAHGTLLQRCVKGWRQYIETQRLKRHQQEIADHQAAIWVKRRTWLQWKHQMSINYEQMVMEQQALHFWAFSLISKTWSVWLSTLHKSREEQDKLQMAEQYSNRKQIRVVWTAWKNYRTVRKLKSIQRRVAERHYDTTLASRMLSSWVWQWHRQVQLSQFDDLITYKAAVARARRALVHWKFYVLLQHQKIEKEIQAEAHYRRHLLQTCLNGLHLQVIERRLKEMRKQMAEQACYKLELKRTWRVWMKRCEHSEELKLYTQTKKARSHYGRTLQHKCLRYWVSYCQWRRYRHAQYSVADNHYRQAALPRYFVRFKMYVELMHEKKDNNMIAGKFRREVLYAQGFYKWQAAYHLQLDLRMMNRMAILHHDEMTKRRFVRYWARQTRELLRMNKLQEIASEHNNHRVLTAAVNTWKDFTTNAKNSRSSHHVAVRHYYLGVMRLAWSAWMQYIQQRQVKWHKRALADVHYSHRITSVVLQAWKSSHSSAIQARSKAAEAFSTHSSNRLRELFSTWREHTVEHKNNRHAHHLAKRTWKRALIMKVFHSWRNYAALHASRTEEKFIRVQELRKTLDKGKVRRAFHAWDTYAKTSAVQRSLHQKAVAHHNRGLTRRSINAWRTYTKLQFRVQILHRQSMWLHNRRITSVFFRRWRHQFSISVEIKKQSMLALWHWSVTLQRQAFYGWLQYAISRKRKEVRIAHALEQRRSRLLRTGVTQWMKLAFHLASERTRYAQARHLEEARGVQQCVYRCAMHWRRWAAERARKRGDSPRHLPRTQQTSKGHIHRPTPVFDSTLLSGRTAQDHPDSSVMSDLFRVRPKPRVPDYLRESYDVTQIAMETDKHPFPPYPYPSTGTSTAENLHVPGASGSGTEEDVPRSAPPLPSPRPRLTIHPKGRPPGEESILFPPSSEGEGESFISNRSAAQKSWTQISRNVPSSVESGSVPKLATSRVGGPVLLPPSCFAPAKKTTSVARETTLVTRESKTALPSYKKQTFPGGSDTAPESSSDHSEVSTSESEADDDDDDDDESTGATPPLLSNANIQNQILIARDKLQKYHDMKVKYREKVRQKEELYKVVRHQRELSLDDCEVKEELADAEELLIELTEEVQIMSKKIDEDRPIVEQLALSINELISRSGLAKA